MGVSGKWLRTLIGLRKAEKSQSLNNDENKMASGGRFWHRRKHSVEIDGDILKDELAQNTGTLKEDAYIQSNSDIASSPSSSFQVHAASEIQQYEREQWAATQIQAAFRGFLV